jgi:hypothetical protein
MATVTVEPYERHVPSRRALMNLALSPVCEKRNSFSVKARFHRAKLMNNVLVDKYQ